MVAALAELHLGVAQRRPRLLHRRRRGPAPPPALLGLGGGLGGAFWESRVRFGRGRGAVEGETGADALEILVKLSEMRIVCASAGRIPAGRIRARRSPQPSAPRLSQSKLRSRMERYVVRCSCDSSTCRAEARSIRRHLARGAIGSGREIGRAGGARARPALARRRPRR